MSPNRLFLTLAAALCLAVPCPALAAATPAEDALKNGDWKNAEKLYKAAADNPDAADADADKAKMLSLAAAFFAETAAGTPVAPEASAKNLYMVTLKDGNQFRGKKDPARSNSEEVAFIKDGGTAIILAPNQIAKQAPIKQEERDQQMREELESRHQAADDDIALYLCGVKALSFNQLALAKQYFYEAAMKNPDVRKNVREYLASKLFAQAFFDRSMKKTKSANQKFAELRSKYADCAATGLIDQTIADADAMAAALAQRKEEAKKLAKLKKQEAAAARAEMRRKRREANKELAEIEDDIDSAVAELGDGDPDIAEADKKAAEAQKLMKAAQDGNSRAESNANYKSALDAFRAAAALYQKSLNAKYDRNIDDKLNAVSQKMYWCRKMQTH